MPYSTPNMAVLRVAGHAYTRWRISIAPLSKLLIWTCQTNAAPAPAPGSRTFNIDAGALHNGATFASIKAGQPLYVMVGSQLIRVRIKSVVGDEFGAAVTVAQNNIVWTDNMPIWVYRDYPFLASDRVI